MPKQISPAVMGLLLLTPLAYAKQPMFETRAGAIRGYDAVAYFTQNKPVKGNDRYVLDWNGAAWVFRQRSKPQSI